MNERAKALQFRNALDALALSHCDEEGNPPEGSPYADAITAVLQIVGKFDDQMEFSLAETCPEFAAELIAPAK